MSLVFSTRLTRLVNEHELPEAEEAFASSDYTTGLVGASYKQRHAQASTHSVRVSPNVPSKPIRVTNAQTQLMSVVLEHGLERPLDKDEYAKEDQIWRILDKRAEGLLVLSTQDDFTALVKQTSGQDNDVSLVTFPTPLRVAQASTQDVFVEYPSPNLPSQRMVFRMSLYDFRRAVVLESWEAAQSVPTAFGGLMTAHDKNLMQPQRAVQSMKLEDLCM